MPSLALSFCEGRTLRLGIRRRGTDSVVNDFDLHIMLIPCYANQAMVGAAMPDDIGHTLAHGPREYGFNRGWQHHFIVPTPIVAIANTGRG
jgi:hypothetical protein